MSVCLLLVSAATAAYAEGDDMGVWLEAGVEKKLYKGLEAGIETDMRLQDNAGELDRWGVGASLSYRLYRNEAKTFVVKTEIGARFMRTNHPGYTTMKDSVFVWDSESETDVYKGREYNVTEGYLLNKFRFYASLSASLELGRWKLSIRERYQMTDHDSISVTRHKWRYDYDTQEIGESVEDVWKGTGDARQALRSRLQVSYDIRSCKFDPYAYIEIYNNLEDGCAVQKSRYALGIDYKFMKVNDFKLFYLYQDRAGDDDVSEHVIGLGYCYSF